MKITYPEYRQPSLDTYTHFPQRETGPQKSIEYLRFLYKYFRTKHRGKRKRHTIYHPCNAILMHANGENAKAHVSCVCYDNPIFPKETPEPWLFFPPKTKREEVDKTSLRVSDLDIYKNRVKREKVTTTKEKGRKAFSWSEGGLLSFYFCFSRNKPKGNIVEAIRQIIAA